MQVAVQSGELANLAADLMTVGVFSDELSKNSSVKLLNRALGGALMSAVKDFAFDGSVGTSVMVDTYGKVRAKRVLLVGLGRRDPERAEPWLALGGAAVKAGNRMGATKVAILAEGKEDAERILEWIARGAHLGSYAFNTYRKPKRKSSVKGVLIHWQSKSRRKMAPAQQRAALKRAEVVAAGIALARDLVNLSPMDLYPESFASRGQSMARKEKLKAKVLKPEQMKKMGMGMLLGVGRGSVRTPRLLHLSYEPPGSKNKKPIVFVGKGVTFDSGGLSLKPSSAMVDMKIDMGGGAAVMGAMLAIARLKPKMPVHGIIGLAENMPSGNAIRPGDVLKGAAGKTVEVNNTDAEGRLVLADALWYAQQLNPAKIIDLATLTGACVVALGNYTVGAFFNDESMADEVLGSARRAGEDFWRMPLNERLREQLKSDVADMKNSGERWGGAITAALFLKEFVGDTPWTHLDIAGPASSTKETSAVSKGGTGVGVATLVDYVIH